MRFYHGSPYKTDVLKPGILWSGEKTEWDHMESNEWLYVTTDRNIALQQGFASALEKAFKADRIQTKGNRIKIYITDGIPDPEAVHALELYLYTIDRRPEDGWFINNNPFNGLYDEYKTTNVIKEGIVSVEKIDVGEWLKTQRLEFVDS